MDSLLANKKLILSNLSTIKWGKRIDLCLKSADHRVLDVLMELEKVNISLVCNNIVSNNTSNNIILFCVVKNDIDKMVLFLNHYRKLGVGQFVFIDNSSSDGTREFLQRQNDVTLYTTTDEYSSARRVAWINHILINHGMNKWCIVVDSDEFLSFVKCEEHTIADVINAATIAGTTRIGGFLLDMYPKDNLFVNHGDSFVSENVYFDSSGYEIKQWRHGLAIKGGPRKRAFGCNVYLSKCPLFYFSEEVFYANSHYLLPDKPVSSMPIWFAILHYKFVDQKDYYKIKEAVQKENYYNGSIEYKAYLACIQGNEFISFYDPRFSAKYNSSQDLLKICFLKSAF